MADADGKMRMEKNADNKKSMKEKTRNADGDLAEARVK